ncbi:GumC family protein [Aequorivita echinoideorum]|uniref:non-specific protein-tyrosine kinase n=1 Tax=Aequorivita echinoideorum TaxID=1549647 RepID=A0ABS5S3Z7_9FLAO|nr:polysaccharide biosynthesis tyrosine autokinase [Aequorivita echinoideorum]MBT0607918.1 polysaccharide biosynthesis tyrosine autokinase [Aequorivita echinoideorum]
MQDLPQNKEQEQEVSLREQIDIYLRNWPWFVITMVVAFIIAFIYLRYTVPYYSSTATILIKNEGNNQVSELAAFQDLGLAGTLNASDFDNELEILRSKNLTERVVDELNLSVIYNREGNIKDAELFSDRPFHVKVMSTPDNQLVSGKVFYITPKSLTKFSIYIDENSNSQDHNFGDLVNLGWGTIMVTPNVEVLKDLDEANSFGEIRVTIADRESVVANLRSAMEVSQMSKSSSIIQLTLTSALPDKARAILDEFIEQYNADAINDRNMVAKNTADFIQNRLEIITNELDSVETGKVEFKEENRLTDINAEGQIFLENASEFNKRQMEVETQIELVNTMIDYLQNGSKSDLLPANLGVSKEGFSEQINTYNQLVLERNRLLQSSTEKNPLVLGLDSEIGGMRNNVMESLMNVKRSLQITRRDIGSQNARIGSEISEIPLKEKEFRNISRQQEIKESLYLYLLQKREETAISLAVTTPKAKVVDPAYSSRAPISPKKQIILLGALLVGLLIPFLVIYVKQLLDNKIRNRAYVERHSKQVPIVGEVPKIGKREAELITFNDHSILAESFRILRTNLQYLFVNKNVDESRGKKIFVTSTVKGEGKTFVSSNLAITLANSGASVILVGADIRNPQLQRYLTGKYNKEGVVEYLVDLDSNAEDYIQKSNDQKNLSLMVSGTIPPNPAELWMQPRAAQLFEELANKFDFVVVDTAPSMLVTDTLLINKYADITLYAIRAGYTEKKLLGFPLESIKNNKLNNVAFVLNDVSMANFGYGNKYGYTYQREEKSFWQKIFNR